MCLENKRGADQKTLFAATLAFPGRWRWWSEHVIGWVVLSASIGRREDCGNSARDLRAQYASGGAALAGITRPRTVGRCYLRLMLIVGQRRAPCDWRTTSTDESRAER